MKISNELLIPDLIRVGKNKKFKMAIILRFAPPQAD
jgi:hypothetical protein